MTFDFDKCCKIKVSPDINNNVIDISGEFISINAEIYDENILTIQGGTLNTLDTALSVAYSLSNDGLLPIYYRGFNLI